MPRRGERIGDAYIRIHADGAAISPEVRKDLDALDKEVGSRGQGTGSEYMKGVARGVQDNKKVTNRSILNALEGTQGETEKRGRLIAGRLMDGIRKQLEGTEGRDISAAMTNLLVRGINEGTIKNKKAIRDLLADEQRFAQLRATAIRDLVKAENEAHVEALRLNKIFDQQRLKTGQLSASITNFDDRMNNFRVRTHRFALAFGVAFGRGSRNDFLNFTGSFVRNILLAGAELTRFSLLTVRGLARIGLAGKTAFEGGGLFAAVRAMGTELGSLAPGLAKLVTSPVGLIGLVAGFAAVTVTLQGVISLFIGLGTAVGAVALTIGGALVGGLGLLLALLAPVTFGIGGLVAAIFSMDEAAKTALKQSLKPLTDQLKELGGIVAKEAFAGIEKDVARLNTVLKGSAFKDFAASVGFGIRRFREEMVQGLIDSEDFFKELAKGGNQAFSIGEQIESLGTILRQTFGGLGGIILAAQIPLTSFLLDLEELTADFNRFANDTSIGGGRDQITTFFENALASIRSLGGLLRSTGGLFVDLFNTGGADAGIALIDSIRGKIEELRNFIRANPATVREFFGDAVAITKAVGGALLGIIEIFAALDTAASRTGVINFFTFLAGIFATVADAINAVNDALAKSGGFLENLIPGFGRITDAMGLARDASGTTSTEFANTGSVFERISQQINSNPFSPQFNPAGVQEAQVGFGTVLAAGAEVNASPLFPQVTMTQVDAFDARLKQIAAETQVPKVINVQAPQDPVLALIEKINFISLSLSAIKPANIQLTGAEKIPTIATQLKNLQTALSAIRPKSVSVTAPAINGVIARLAFVNAVTFKPKTVKITLSPADAGLSKISALSTAINGLKNKTVTITTNYKTTGTKPKASGGIEAPIRMAAGGFANFRQFLDPFTIVGESGREAIVPLDRPLGEVDPAVRELAAFAQGKFDQLLASSIAKQGINASGWTIVTPTEDPVAVAAEVLNRLTAMSY